MHLNGIRIKGYRSVRSLRFPVGPLSVFVGRNGVGKTNLYRGLALLHAAATGTLAREIALEGGLGSVLWAGKTQKNEPRRLILAAELDDLEYTIEIGLPRPGDAALGGELWIKEETLTDRSTGRAVTLMERKGVGLWLRDGDGKRQRFDDMLLASETALASFRDAERFTELARLRQAMQDWRLYHEFRTDADAPVRQPCLAIATGTLAPDASDLAAVFATLAHIREDMTEVMDAVTHAFPGARLRIGHARNTCSFSMRFSDLPEREQIPPRWFAAQELSDGTLKFLCLAGALCAYRVPSFIALNEPEASLHPDLMPALARLIVRAAERARVWVVTHSDALAAEIAQLADVTPRQVVKQEAETWIEGLTLVGTFRDG